VYLCIRQLEKVSERANAAGQEIIDPIS